MPGESPQQSATICARGEVAGAAGLTAFLERHRRIAVLSGAGCSTASGIPDYRDQQGRWKHQQPVQFADFKAHAGVRRRYWARSYAGWNRVSHARPNAAHTALAQLERAGRVTGVITQNVDNLHRRAGGRNIVDLHGVLHRVRCLQCRQFTPRRAFQTLLGKLNADWRGTVLHAGPDGDSTLAADDVAAFAVPDCRRCGGIVKPDVVFFGEAVPSARVSRAAGLLEASDALLVVGSSLMVFSGFRFARMAHAAGIPIAILNLGVTRADALATWRFAGDCTALLPASLAALGG